MWKEGSRDQFWMVCHWLRQNEQFLGFIMPCQKVQNFRINRINVIHKRAWGSIRILQKFTIPDLIRTSDLDITESEIKKLVIWLSDLEIHGYIEKTSSKSSEKNIYFQQYHLRRNTGPLYPKICDICGHYITKNVCQVTETNANVNILGNAFSLINISEKNLSWIYMLSNFILFYKIREICKICTFKEINKYINCNYKYFKQLCNADININNKDINKLHKLLDIFAEDILLWPMNNEEKKDYKKKNKNIPNILFLQVKHYIEKYNDFDMEIFLSEPPGSIKPR